MPMPPEMIFDCLWAKAHYAPGDFPESSTLHHLNHKDKITYDKSKVLTSYLLELSNSLPNYHGPRKDIRSLRSAAHWSNMFNEHVRRGTKLTFRIGTKKSMLSLWCKKRQKIWGLIQVNKNRADKIAAGIEAPGISALEDSSNLASSPITGTDASLTDEIDFSRVRPEEFGLMDASDFDILNPDSYNAMDPPIVDQEPQFEAQNAENGNEFERDDMYRIKPIERSVMMLYPDNTIGDSYIPGFHLWESVEQYNGFWHEKFHDKNTGEEVQPSLAEVLSLIQSRHFTYEQNMPETKVAQICFTDKLQKDMEEWLSLLGRKNLTLDFWR